MTVFEHIWLVYTGTCDYYMIWLCMHPLYTSINQGYQAHRSSPWSSNVSLQEIVLFDVSNNYAKSVTSKAFYSNRALQFTGFPFHFLAFFDQLPSRVGEHGLWWLHHHLHVSFCWGPRNSTNPAMGRGWCRFHGSHDTCSDMLGYSRLGYFIPKDASQDSFFLVTTFFQLCLAMSGQLPLDPLSAKSWRCVHWILQGLMLCMILDSFTSLTNPKGLSHQFAINLEVLYWYSPRAGFRSGLWGGPSWS